jgi:hypothetical protein
MMYLPLTSIEDAWGSNSVPVDTQPPQPNRYNTPDYQKQFLQEHGHIANEANVGAFNPKTQIDDLLIDKQHVLPTRVDVPLFNKKLVEVLLRMEKPERTEYVTRACMNSLPNESTLRKQPAQPKPGPEGLATQHKLIETYHEPHITMAPGNSNSNSNNYSGSWLDEDFMLVISMALVMLFVDRVCTIIQRNR